MCKEIGTRRAKLTGRMVVARLRGEIGWTRRFHNFIEFNVQTKNCDVVNNTATAVYTPADPCLHMGQRLTQGGSNYFFIRQKQIFLLKGHSPMPLEYVTGQGNTPISHYSHSQLCCSCCHKNSKIPSHYSSSQITSLAQNYATHTIQNSFTNLQITSVQQTFLHFWSSHHTTHSFYPLICMQLSLSNALQIPLGSKFLTDLSTFKRLHFGMLYHIIFALILILLNLILFLSLSSSQFHKQLKTHLFLHSYPP